MKHLTPEQAGHRTKALGSILEALGTFRKANTHKMVRMAKGGEVGAPPADSADLPSDAGEARTDAKSKAEGLESPVNKDGEGKNQRTEDVQGGEGLQDILDRMYGFKGKKAPATEGGNERHETDDNDDDDEPDRHDRW